MLDGIDVKKEPAPRLRRIQLCPSCLGTQVPPTAAVPPTREDQEGKEVNTSLESVKWAKEESWWLWTQLMVV